MAAQRDLVELDLLAQDQVQQEVEGPLEHRRLDVDSHGPQVSRAGAPCELHHL